jgi:hypothetical protein
VAFERAQARLKLRQNKLLAEDIELQRADGEVRGWIFANFDAERVAFDLAVHSNPNELAPLLGPPAAAALRPYRFGPRTRATVRGKVDFRQPAQTAWQAAITNEGFAYWKLHTTRARADLMMTNQILRIENFDAALYDGNLRGRATFALTNDVSYRLDLQAERVNIHPLLADITGQSGESHGRLTGEAWVTGTGSDRAGLQGAGRLSIEDGLLWEVPLFGIFSRILNDIAPGLGMARATKADCTFVLADQVARTDDLKIGAGAFSLSCNGQVGFDGKLDFRVRGQLLKGVLGINILTWFLSNIFEYKVGGTLGNYSYRPVNLPKEFLPHGGPKDRDRQHDAVP